MDSITRFFHEPQGLLYHGAALLYGVVGYVLGLTGLFSENPWVNAGATLLLGHAMTICAYMIHECGHNTVFRDNEHNARLGRVPELDLRHVLRHIRRHPLQAFPPPHG